MENDDAIFQEVPGRFWERKALQIGYGNVLDFCLGNFKMS